MKGNPLATQFVDQDPGTHFHTDSTKVYFRYYLIKGADIATFEVCDSGKKALPLLPFQTEEEQASFVPYGYAKDQNHVYYYNFDGKTNIVQKTIPSSFHSLGDGLFGYDQQSVFYGRAVIPNANPATWAKLGEKSFYSKDQNRIYYLNRLIKQADPATFEVVAVPTVVLPPQWARDQYVAYSTDKPISHPELEQLLKR